MRAEHSSDELVEFGNLLAEPLRNGLTRPSAVRGAGVFLVNMGELFRYPRMHDVPMERAPLAERELRYLLQPGDLLFARQSLTLEGAGKCSIFLGCREPVTFESHIIRARLDLTKCDPLYWYYFFRSRSGRDSITSIVEQVAAAGIRGSDLARLRVPLRRLREQRAIAAVLGALDDKIDLNRRMSETLEETARALFKSWFVDFDPVRANAEGRQPFGMDAATPSLFPNRFAPSEQGEIPAGWRAGTLGDIAIFHNSKRVPLSSRQRDERRGNYPYYGAAGVVDHIDGYLFDGTYILVGEDGSVVNDDGSPVTQYVWGKFWVNNHAHVLTGAGDVSLEWLLLLLRSRDVRPYVTGAVQPKLSQGRLRESPVVVPATLPLRKFSEVAEPLFAKVRQARDESRTLAELRDYLLPKLLSGEVRVRDAEKLVGEAT